MLVQTFGPSVMLSYDYLPPNHTHQFFWDFLGWDPSSYQMAWTFTAYPDPFPSEFPELTGSVEITEVYWLRKGQELGDAANEVQLNMVFHNNGDQPVSYFMVGYAVGQ